MNGRLYLAGWKILTSYIALWREKKVCGDLLILDLGKQKSIGRGVPEIFHESLKELIDGGVISSAKELANGEEEKLEVRFTFTVIEAIVDRSFNFPEELQENTARAILSAAFQCRD